MGLRGAALVLHDPRVVHDLGGEHVGHVPRRRGDGSELGADAAVGGLCAARAPWFIIVAVEEEVIIEGGREAVDVDEAAAADCGLMRVEWNLGNIYERGVMNYTFGEKGEYYE